MKKGFKSTFLVKITVYKNNFNSTPCRKTRVKNLVFSYIRRKKITLYTEILTLKIDLHTFSLVSCVKKNPQINFCHLNYSLENKYLLQLAIYYYVIAAVELSRRALDS